MTHRTISVRGIFDQTGELVRILYKTKDGKTCFGDVEPSNDSSIDTFLMEIMPPEEKKEEVQKQALEMGQTLPQAGPINVPTN